MSRSRWQRGVSIGSCPIRTAFRVRQCGYDRGHAAWTPNVRYFPPRVHCDSKAADGGEGSSVTTTQSAGGSSRLRRRHCTSAGGPGAPVDTCNEDSLEFSGIPTCRGVSMLDRGGPNGWTSPLFRKRGMISSPPVRLAPFLLRVDEVWNDPAVTDCADLSAPVKSQRWGATS